MLLASAFASSPAGVFSSVGVAAILAGITAQHFYTRKRLDDQDTNSALLDKAVGILVSQIAPLDGRVGKLELGQSTLSTAQAVLQEQVRAHEQWSRDRVQDAARATRIRNRERT